MTTLIPEHPACVPTITPPSDERLYDWAIAAPGESVPAVCGVCHTLASALHAAQCALTHQDHAAVAHVWAVDLGLSSGRGYRREPWPRWSVELTEGRELHVTR